MKYKLGEVCTKIGSGATPRGGKESYFNEGISLIRSQNILDFSFSNDGLAHISELQAEQLSNVNVESMDILLNITGDSVARACIVPDNVLPARVNQHVSIIRTDITKADYRYILYYIQSIKQYLIQISSSGATRKALTKAMIEDIELELPSLEKQSIIGNMLSSLDAKISENTKINHHLAEITQAIFKSWFEKFEPWDGEMPENWSYTTLDSLCSLISKGITPKYDETSAEIVINQKCIRNKEIDLRLARKHQPKRINEKWLQYGDVLINSTGEGTLGRAAQFLFDGSNYTVDSHITIIRPTSDELVHFIGQWSLQRESEFASMASGSTGQTDLPRERLKAMECILPDVETLKNYSVIVKPIVEKQVAYQKENARLADIRDAILPRLMSGELSVADLLTS
jgi:type I restriction enzyme S subunit